MSISILSTGNQGYTGGNRNSKKIVLIMIIALIALIVIGGAIFAYTYFFTDAFLSEQQGFYKYFAKNEEIVEMLKDKDLEKYIEKTKKEAYSSNGEFSVNITGDIDEDIKQIVDEISKNKVIIKQDVDRANKYMYQELNYKYGEKDILSESTIIKNDYYGHKINEVIKPYIILENNNLKDLAKKLGAGDEELKYVPNKIDFEKLKGLITKEELKQIKVKYLKAIMEDIPEDRFSKNETEGMDVYTLSINEDTAKIIAVSVLDTLINDELVLGKIKKIGVEIIGLAEQEVQVIIDGLKKDLQEAKDNLIKPQSTENNNLVTPGISQDIAPIENADKNVYIDVYVSNSDLVKTEIKFGDEGKISLLKEKNKVIFEFAEEESSEDNNSKVFKTLASIILEKNKNNDELTYEISIMDGEYNRKIIAVTLSYTGFNGGNSLNQSLLLDYDLAPLIYAKSGIINSAQNAANDAKNSLEKESVAYALSDLITNMYEDKYISGNEFTINETTIKQALIGQNLDMNVSMNEDGTYRLYSNTTGIIYTVDSTGRLIESREPSTSEDSLVNNIPEHKTTEEKSMIMSFNIKSNTTFGAIQQQELTENDMYIINKMEDSDDIMEFFAKYSEKVQIVLLNAYKNTPIGQLMGQ